MLKCEFYCLPSSAQRGVDRWVNQGFCSEDYHCQHTVSIDRPQLKTAIICLKVSLALEVLDGEILLRSSRRSDQLYRLSTCLDSFLIVKPLSTGTCGRSNCTHERGDRGCESSAWLTKQSHLLQRHKNCKIPKIQRKIYFKQTLRLYWIRDGGDKQGHLSYKDNRRLGLNCFLKIPTVQWKIVCLNWHWQESNQRQIGGIVCFSHNQHLPKPLWS